MVFIELKPDLYVIPGLLFASIDLSPQSMMSQEYEV